VFYQATPFGFASQCEIFDGLAGDRLEITVTVHETLTRRLYAPSP
jgi:hypothetical protein